MCRGTVFGNKKNVFRIIPKLFPLREGLLILELWLGGLVGVEMTYNNKKNIYSNLMRVLSCFFELNKVLECEIRLK